MFSDNTGGQGFGGAIFEFDDEDLSTYDTLKFSIDTTAFTGFANLTVQLEPPVGGTPGGNVALAAYTPVASGNWNTYEIPLADFTAVNPAVVNRLGFFNARDGADVLLAGTLYLDDIHFTTAGDGGGGGGDSELLINGDFEAGVNPWLLGTTNSIGEENVIDENGNNVFFVDVTVAGNAFDVNLTQKLAITPGETYALSFKAKSNVARSMLAGIGQSGGSFFSATQTVNLTTDWQTFEIEVTATDDNGGGDFGEVDSRVLFDMGAEIGEVYIDDVSLVVSTGSGPAAGELAVNGDFETGGFDNWEQFVNSGVQAISTETPPNGGSFSAALSANTAVGLAGTTEIKQANLGSGGGVALGDVLNIQFDVKGTFGPGGQLNVLSFTELGGGGGTLSDQTVVSGGVDDWTRYDYNVTLGGPDASGGFSLAFNPVCGAVAGCFADVFIDNVSITTQ